MKSLLKIAFFCLIFCGISQIGFGQVDTANLSPDYLKGFGYVDSTYFKDITFLESKITTTRKISSVKNNTTGEVLTLVEEFPQFPGGKAKMVEYIQKKLKWPAHGIKDGLKGAILVEIKITESGIVENHRIIKGESKSLDKEALRVIKLMPAWAPAKQNGKPVSSFYTIPVTFWFIGLERER
jgi:TonB family protein